MSFSTLNESNLHKTLKIMYSESCNGKTEVEMEGHIYDIVSKENEIIEIQTKNLASLLPKIMDTLEKGYKIKIIHPIPIVRMIETYNSESQLISKRKSPVRGSIYSLFKELTGIYPILLHKNFTLEVLEINMTEIRTKTSELTQSKNNRRRFKKDWNKINKRLDEIITTRIFKTKEDYLELLPETLPEEFSAKILKNCMINDLKLSAKAAQNANLILWVYSRMELIKYLGIKERSKIYRINR
ncbi:MAG: hypothetical protein MJ162_02805 [Treponema sp.]|nr:hypothetical protein [Treponema sp.]